MAGLWVGILLCCGQTPSRNSSVLAALQAVLASWLQSNSKWGISSLELRTEGFQGLDPNIGEQRIGIVWETRLSLWVVAS